MFKKIILPLLGSLCLYTSAAAQAPSQPVLEKAYFAGGCFWCVEADFDKVEGVLKTVSGYANSQLINPSYKSVSSGRTGAKEAVEITYDPAIVSYETLTRHLLRHIDPTDGGGQFCDRGDQYASAIYTKTQTEKEISQKALNDAQKLLKTDIKTETLTFKNFYAAEEYHQDYYKKNPIRYKFYRYNCGRDKKIDTVWKNQKF